ncbi:HSP20-like chaperones superfamily protein [Striga hermonthica]|uniref:HSP20-like chaperones superfamily protein n=1 Tax=Striga hermonthica TaxID=68872 RepID=A0A9N7RC76_STRHE|nr:HSP20-like chaperones superfamily protein [Striga hermonthica]
MFRASGFEDIESIDEECLDEGREEEREKEKEIKKTTKENKRRLVDASLYSVMEKERIWRRNSWDGRMNEGERKRSFSSDEQNFFSSFLYRRAPPPPLPPLYAVHSPKRDKGQTWSSPIVGQGHLDPYTTDLEQKRLMLQMFQEENPGFDFSQAQFSGGCPDPWTFMGGIRSP